MSGLVITCLDAPFSETSMRLKLRIPNKPYRMPLHTGGRVIIKGYEGDDCLDGCATSHCSTRVLKAESDNHCHNHRPEKLACGCQATAKVDDQHCCDKRKLERFEIIEYSGFQPDGVTLIVTERGVDGTAALNWCLGSEVIQECIQCPRGEPGLPGKPGENANPDKVEYNLDNNTGKLSVSLRDGEESESIYLDDDEMWPSIAMRTVKTGMPAELLTNEDEMYGGWKKSGKGWLVPKTGVYDAVVRQQSDKGVNTSNLSEDRLASGLLLNGNDVEPKVSTSGSDTSEVGDSNSISEPRLVYLKKGDLVELYTKTFGNSSNCPVHKGTFLSLLYQSRGNTK